MESWNPVEGFEQYKVSNLGRILSTRGKPKKTWIGKGGFEFVTLAVPKKEKFPVHKLVATAHIPNPNNLNMIKHVDGDIRNNVATNLQWVFPTESN